MTDLAEIRAYNAAQDGESKKICAALFRALRAGLPDADCKVWHRHPVWFIDGNPVAGYSVRKVGVTLLFWSGQSFREPDLVAEGSFKAAEARYTSVKELDAEALERWLQKARAIQWDYKNIVKRRGKLVRIKSKAPVV